MTEGEARSRDAMFDARDWSGELQLGSSHAVALATAYVAEARHYGR